jgi:hypothetical protein
MSKKLPSQKIVKGQIADSSGHTDFSGGMDDAIALIMDQVKTAGKWVYVNGSPHIFNNVEDPAEEAALRETLEREEEPEFVLTGKLQGGASKTVTRQRILKTPVTSYFSSKSRPQLAVVFKKNHGKTFIDIVGSNYKGSRAKLAKYKANIIAAVNEMLSSK